MVLELKYCIPSQREQKCMQRKIGTIEESVNSIIRFYPDIQKKKVE